MEAHSPEAIGRRMDALGLWESVYPCNWAVKPHGVAFPYFCTALKGDRPEVKVRFLMLEGWQTLHDFVRTRQDRFFGFCSSPTELPHFELMVLSNGMCHLARHEAGYVPRPLKDAERPLVANLLWESYGVMMRLENAGPALVLTYAGEQSFFARIESADGTWTDGPLAIPPPRPHVEKVSFAKEDIAKAKDIPFDPDYGIEVDFRILPTRFTREARPRLCYALVAVDDKTGEKMISLLASMNPETGLRGLWEGMPGRLLKELIAHGRIPGRVKTVSARVFRLVSPLGIELPFKLSLHDRLENLEKAYAGI